MNTEKIDWNEASNRGLIVRINTEILHPLGLAMCRNVKDGTSPYLLVSDDGVWTYSACDQGVFDNGKSVCLVDIPKDTAEVICRNLSAVTGWKVDWHYIGGRVHMKALPSPTEQPQGKPVLQWSDDGLLWSDGEEHEMASARAEGYMTRTLYLDSAEQQDTGTDSDKYKAELYDEVWAKAKSMGFMNVTMALEKLVEKPASVTNYRSYTTQPAESLAGMAARQLKDESRWIEIRDANAHVFPDMRPSDYYPVGTVIKVPCSKVVPVAVVMPKRMNEHDAVQKLLGRFGVYGLVPADVATDIYNSALSDVANLNEVKGE